MTKKRCYFDNFVGQETVKKTLSVYVDAHRNGQVIPHILAVAPKGAGKTMFCRRFQDLLVLRENVMEVNGSQMKSPKQVVEDLFHRIHTQKKGVSVFIDECHAMSRSVQDMFLSILNKTHDNVTKIEHDGISYRFDFKNKVTFLFATTERQLLFPPLLDRMEEISFSNYSNAELVKILRINTKNLVDEDALVPLVRYNRGNARSVAKLAEKVNSYCVANSISLFTVDMIDEFVSTMGIYEEGLTMQELDLLRILSQNSSGVTLTAIASQTGNTRASQLDLEKFPLKKGLMYVDGKRKLTTKGKSLIEKVYG